MGLYRKAHIYNELACFHAIVVVYHGKILNARQYLPHRVCVCV